MNKPTLYMMCGLPGSGKSTMAARLPGVVFSSDEIRMSMFGDVNDRKNNPTVFQRIHNGIIATLKNGEDAIFDATNLAKKYRIHFLSLLKDIPCHKVCYVMATTYETCLYNNNHRQRHVPKLIIDSMHKKFQPPHYSEGWDDIRFVYARDDEAPSVHIGMLMDYNQHNPHHTLTLGKHLMRTHRYIEEHCEDHNLAIAARLHDIGKPYVQIIGNDGVAHYISHECTSAYTAMFYVVRDYDRDIVDIINLVYYHMRPYVWETSPSAYEKDLKLLGKEFIERLQLLHEADKEAH